MTDTTATASLPSLRVVLIKRRSIVFNLLLELIEKKGLNPSESERIDLRMRETAIRLELEDLNVAIRRELIGKNPIPVPSDEDVTAILKNISEVERLTSRAMTISALIRLADATLALSNRIAI